MLNNDHINMPLDSSLQPLVLDLGLGTTLHANPDQPFDCLLRTPRPESPTVVEEIRQN